MAFRSSENGFGPKPVIGMACARDKSQRYYGLPVFIQNQTYLRAVADAGGAPVAIPLHMDEATLHAIYQRLDGVFLPGGEDVDPANYGAEPHELLGAVDPERDRIELLLTRWALADGKPVLAVCRGMQLLNVAAGGTLVQDIRALRPDSERHDYFPPEYQRFRISHEVTFEAGSRLGRIFGDRIRANSMHHQALSAIGQGCRAVAWAPDGVVEGLEVTGHPFALGVQWHPEELAPRNGYRVNHQLFAAFVQHCKQVDAAMAWQRSGDR